MATFTSNYGLHQWAPEDNFLRTDFNEDLKKIDEALEKIAAETGKKTEVVNGFFMGDNSAEREIRLGFSPSAVLLEMSYGRRCDQNYYSYGGLAISGLSLGKNDVALFGTANGFKVARQGNAYTNQSGERYYYLAFR